LKYPVYFKGYVFGKSAFGPEAGVAGHSSLEAAFPAELQQPTFIVRLRVDNYSWLSVTRRELDYDPHIAGSRKWSSKQLYFSLSCSR
jgi:hypothetical protein